MGRLAFTIDRVRCKIEVSNFWNYIVKVACVKLEHPGLPVFAVKVSVEYLFRDCIVEYILIKIKGDELLNSSKDPASPNEYLGL